VGLAYVAPAAATSPIPFFPIGGIDARTWERWWLQGARQVPWCGR